MPLLLDVLADDVQRRTASGCGEVGRGPEVPVHDVPFTRHEDQMDAERRNNLPATAC
jgi:hypothetical protein